MVLTPEGVEEQLAGRTADDHCRRPWVSLEGLTTRIQYDSYRRWPEGPAPEPTQHSPDVGVRLGIELSRLPAVTASADVFVVDEELVGVAGPIGPRSTQR